MAIDEFDTEDLGRGEGGADFDGKIGGFGGAGLVFEGSLEEELETM